MHVSPNVSREKLISIAKDHIAIVEALKNKNLSRMVKLLSAGLV
jgi:hypothetical protein